MAKIGSGNPISSVVIGGMVMHISNPKFSGDWFRVIQRTDSKLIISRDGLEIPNTECVFVHSDTTILTLDDVRHCQKCYEEYMRTNDISLPGEWHVVGYYIDTEEASRILYCWDADSSMHGLCDANKFIMLRIR